MSYNPCLEYCVVCHHVWKEGDRVFGYYEHYVCSDCVKKGEAGTFPRVAFESYPKELVK